jgi:hypothetical protein
MKTTTALGVLFASFLHYSVIGSDLVTYNITATVVSVDDPLGLLVGSVDVEDTLTGVLQYDLSINMADDDPSPNSSSRLVSPPGDNFLQGTNGASGFFETIDFFFASTENDADDGDFLAFIATGDTTPSTLSFPGADYVDLEVMLHDSDGTVLSNDLLPASLDLADFEGAELFLSSEGSTAEPPYYFLLYEVRALITSITAVSAPDPTGDFNDDGVVDAADYTVWRDGLGKTYNENDYFFWRDNYGDTVAASMESSSAKTVPEPTSFVLVLLASLALGRFPCRA